ncbi:MAG: DNA repair protein RecO [Anaerostipes sp.]|jgi:DNA repair protein RecO (recombination protein O)|nr:DNA repair protein RecO [Anaerostipes sp.]MDD3745186.1 DNA repair protein RecO [Anaerostipes sp.]
MGQEVKVQGLVLQTGNIGEYDKRVVLLTKERGRISAFARGAKKPTSSYAAACQPFTFGTFTLYEGKNSFNLMWSDIDYYFEKLKTDLDLIYYASYFCELASYLTRENNDEFEILKLLYQSLRALEKKTIPEDLIRYVYEIRILACYGLAMEAFACTNCGKMDDLIYFSSRRGGILCSECREKGEQVLTIGQSTLYTIQFILSSKITKLYTFKVSDEVLVQLKKITKSYMKEHVNYQFKSLEFLKLIG